MPHPVREIIVFANGHPRKMSTWSNVPACIVKELERRQVRVHAVDLLCHPAQRCYDHTIRILLRLLLLPFGIHPPYYVRTHLHRWWAERKIRRAVMLFPAADYCLFFNYLFYNRYGEKPSLLLGDWPTPFDIRRKGRRPTFLDRRSFLQEQEAITHARHVVTIFRVRAEEMRAAWPAAPIRFIGPPFVNNCYGKHLPARKIIARKKRSGILLFIGKPDRYRCAAQLLIDAFALLLRHDPHRQLQLHIVGMRGEGLSIPPSLPVVCHGYLHKDHDAECAAYYQLMIAARMMICPSARWAAYSSLVEGMYFYTPVIVTPFDAFTDTFGEEIAFGCYTSCTPHHLTAAIRYLCDTTDYPELCRRAHEEVRHHTCARYVKELLHLMQQ